MPGKVNPVLCKSVLRVATQVVGCYAMTIALCGQAGNFELNTMMPIGIAAPRVDQRCRCGCSSVHDKCIDGVEANKERCAELVDKTLAMVTALVPAIGYDAAREHCQGSFCYGSHGVGSVPRAEIAIGRGITPGPRFLAQDRSR